MKHDGYGPLSGRASACGSFHVMAPIGPSANLHDGVCDFDALHSRARPRSAAYAFDVLALDGDELRVLPLYLCKTRQIYSASSLIGRTESP